MNYFKLNGVDFGASVAISALEQNFNVLDGPNTERAMTGLMLRDIIGTYIGHSLTLFAKPGEEGAEAFDALWNFLIDHSVDEEGVMVEAADGQTSISYLAYYTSGTRKLPRVENGVNHWDEISINFIPMDAQVRPS